MATKTSHEKTVLNKLARDLGWERGRWYHQYPLQQTNHNGYMGVMKADALNAQTRTLVEIKGSRQSPLVGTKQIHKYMTALNLYVDSSPGWRGILSNGKQHYVQYYENGLPTTPLTPVTVQQLQETQKHYQICYNKWQWKSESVKNTWSEQWGRLRHCHSCGKEKAAIDFHYRATARSYRRYACKTCENRDRTERHTRRNK